MGERDDTVRNFFDSVGDGEWERLTRTRRAQTNLAIHHRFLAEFVNAGDRVLEIGAGPGRFTIAMAQLGASVVVTDVSAVQLDLNRRHVEEAGCEGAVESRYLLDIRDTDCFQISEFDAVLAFGGPLSYVFDDAEVALAGLLRVGRVVVASVMSTIGSWRFFLANVVEEASILGLDAIDALLETGDQRYEHDLMTHPCKMFRWREVAGMVERCGGEVLAASASNWASMADDDVLEPIARDPEHWRRFVEHEIKACREPGAIDGGSLILFSARRA